MQVHTIGIDLAKNVFQIHGVDEQHKIVVARQLRRKQMIPFFSKLAPCLIGMEACATAQHWARELTKLGHTVRLIPPVYVKAYVKRSKNDAAAICEAVTRPSMQIRELDRCILAQHKVNDVSRRLESIPGIGVMGATAIAATITDPGQFKLGRDLAAWIGLVPKQHSTGGKARLGNISKQGDR